MKKGYGSRGGRGSIRSRSQTRRSSASTSCPGRASSTPLSTRRSASARWSGIADLPAYNEDLDGPNPPPAAVRLRTAIGRADALLFATPEYNSSVPGALKNLLDWASRPYATNVLRQKPVAVVGAST